MAMRRGARLSERVTRANFLFRRLVAMSKVAKGASSSSSVTVGVRIRPLNGAELAASMPAVFGGTDDRKNVEEMDEEGDLVKAWPFDHAFGNDCDNAMIFKTVGKTLVEQALEGYNTVLFMYGQTSSGKTFTLFGGGGHLGLVTHAMEYVHKLVHACVDKEYIINITYAELYNEELKDLLSESPNENLKIIEDPILGPIIQNITEKPFTNATEVKKLLEEGENRRHFGVTNMNAHSSRSHVLVRLGIEARKVASKPANPLRTSWGKDKPTSISTLNLVDLAGSERAGKSGTSGESLKEGSFINKSLLTLGTVIASLTDPKKNKHVPYRDSKLTRLLASALGGNAKTCMLTCISPASGNLVESLSTLRFASRAKRIVNTVQKNEFKDAKALSKQMAYQLAEIEALQAKLKEGQEGGFTGGDGGSIRDTAVHAAKKWRNIKFMMITMPRIQKSFHAAGHTDIAKEVAQDIKQALSSGKGVEEAVSKVADLMANHMPREQKLLEKIERLTMSNESNSLDDVHDGHHSENEEEHEEGTEGSTGDSGHGHLPFDFDSHELREELATKAVALAEKEAEAVAASEAATALRASMTEQEKNMKRIAAAEASTKGDLKELRQVLTEEKADKKKAMEGLQGRIDECRSQLTGREATIADMEKGIVERDKAQDVLKSQLTAVGKDLEQSDKMRKNYENEVVRVKNDLKVQMERLRTNMGNMLKEGGEESKYLEKHNMQLQMDLDSRNDEIALLKEQLSNKEGEMIAVRAELHRYLDDMKVHTQENYLLKEQLSRIGDKARELEDEVVRMNTHKGLAEQRVHDAAGETRDALMEKESELDGLRAESKIALDGAEVEAAELRAALAAQNSRIDDLEMQLGNKKVECARLEKDKKLEVIRFEKKLATAKGHIENQRKGSQELVLALEERNGELESESDGWRHKYDEAQQWVDQMNGFLEGRTELDGGDEGRACDSDTDGDEERSMDSMSRYEETDASFASVSRRDTATSETMESATLSTASAAATTDARPSSATVLPVRMTSPSKSKEALLHVNTFEIAVRFAALRHALGVATKAFRHCVDEEAVVRRFLVSEHQREYDTADKFGAELHRFNTQSSSVVKYRKYLESTVMALEERGERSSARSEALAKEIEGYREQNKGLLVHTAYMAKRSEMQMNEAKSLKIQNDKLRFDLRDLHAGMAALAAERDDASAALERTTDDSIDLSSRLGALDQKYFVMETERDELMKIFQSKHNHSGS